jgi:hypothetical protein
LYLFPKHEFQIHFETVLKKVLSRGIRTIFDTVFWSSPPHTHQFDACEKAADMERAASQELTRYINHGMQATTSRRWTSKDKSYKMKTANFQYASSTLVTYSRENCCLIYTMLQLQ